MSCSPTSSREAAYDDFYTLGRLRCMEKIYGVGYISSGGENTSKDLGKKLRLSPGDCVLDVGSGLGGFAFYLAKHYNVQATGVDIQEELVRISQERCFAMGMSDRVKFIAQDALLADFPVDSFTVVCFRGSFFHLKYEDKTPMLKKVKKWLKPRGQLLMNDLYVGETPGASQEEFKEFSKSLHINLLKIAEYHQMLPEVGLKVTNFEDHRLLYLEQSRACQSLAEKNREDILKEVRREEFDATTTFWTDEVKWAEEGALGKLLIVAEKHQ